MMQKSIYCVNVNIFVKPDRYYEFLGLIKKNQQATLAEKLCKQYQFGQSEQDANTFHFHEEFLGKRFRNTAYYLL
jgi:quinol monooxygenase YgiN